MEWAPWTRRAVLFIKTRCYVQRLGVHRYERIIVVLIAIDSIEKRLGQVLRSVLTSGVSLLDLFCS